MKTLSIFLLLIAQMSIAADKVRISIDVRGKNKAQICTGEEDVIFGGDYRIKKTSYYSKSKLFQNEWIKFNPKNFQIEKYISTNRRTGGRILISLENGDYLISITEKKGAKPRESRLKWKENIIHGKQLTDYLVSNWSKLIAGKTLSFDFLATLHMRLVGFEAYLEKIEGKRYLISVRPSSFVVRMIVPAITFEFLQDRYPMLVSFSGPFLMDDGEHEGNEVDFYFKLEGS